MTIEPKLTTPEQDLGGIARAVLRRWRPALGVLALTLLAAVAVSRFGGQQYQATAQILLQQPDQVNAVLNPDATASAANAQREVNTNADLITSIPVVDAVRHKLRLRESAQSLIDRLSVSGEATSNLVRITARDPRPQQAARIATAVAREYQNYRRGSAQQAIGSAITAARARLDGMTAADRRSAEGQAIDARLHQLEPAQVIATGGVQIVRPAAVPASAVPRLGLLQAAVALLLGLLLAAAVVAILERTDRRLVDDEALEAALGLPLLARVPRSRPWSGAEDAERVAAYNSLAARLRLTAPGRDARVLMVAPAAGRVAGEVDRLAAAISDLGERVLVIMADFRAEGTEPRNPSSGLAAVLRGESTLAAELVHATCSGLGGRPAADAPSWELVPAGECVRRSPSLLGSAALQDVVLEACERADVVIVVAPPLAAAGDVLVLATVCDAIVVAVGPGPMTADAAQRVRDVLAAASLPVLGVVFDRGRRPPAPRAPHRRRPAKAHRSPAGAASEPAQPTTAGV
ncbi:MAG: Wzz/FepE/Etk N-terminal domain-containing protein [Solirubrobacteraceae bacterium]